MAATAHMAAVPTFAVHNAVSVSNRSFQGLRAVAMRSPSFRALSLRSSSAAVVSRRSLKVSCAAQSGTLEVVAQLIADQLDIDKATVLPESKFVDLGADSLDTVEIMMALEEKFDIQLQEENAEKIVTVQNAADLIEDVLATK